MSRKLNHRKLELEKLINEDHNLLIKKTVKIRELEQKINEVQLRKSPTNGVLCHGKNDIEV